MRTYNHAGKLKRPVTLEFDGYTLTLEADQEISLHVVVNDEELKLERASEEIRRLRKLVAEKGKSTAALVLASTEFHSAGDCQAEGRTDCRMCAAIKATELPQETK